MTEIQLFNNDQFGAVRTIEDDGVRAPVRMSLFKNSGYTLANTNEMVEEAFAQLYDGSLSDTSKKVLKTLLEHAANINNSENALIKRRLEKACL